MPIEQTTPRTDTDNLRLWADNPLAGSQHVPLHQDRLRAIANEIDRLREALRYLLAFPGAAEAQRRARELLGNG